MAVYDISSAPDAAQAYHQTLVNTASVGPALVRHVGDGNFEVRYLSDTGLKRSRVSWEVLVGEVTEVRPDISFGMSAGHLFHLHYTSCRTYTKGLPARSPRVMSNGSWEGASGVPEAAARAMYSPEFMTISEAEEAGNSAVAVTGILAAIREGEVWHLFLVDTRRAVATLPVGGGDIKFEDGVPPVIQKIVNRIMEGSNHDPKP